MKPTSKTLLLSSLTIAAGCAAAPAVAAQNNKQPDKRPNIVLIIGDDVRYLDLGCYGSPDSKTPNGLLRYL